MDYNRIKMIKSYSDQIRKFRNLEKYKDIEEDEFKTEMAKLFPDFIKNNKLLFDCIVTNKDMEFLDLMFHKLDDINEEFERRKNELNLIKQDINDIRGLINVENDISKEKVKAYLKLNSPTFLENYPIIIERLMDKETRNLTDSELFLDEIKFKHEKQIGEILANKYVMPKIKK
jgi:hypothetical protein